MGDRPAIWSPGAPGSGAPVWTVHRFESLDSTNRWLLEQSRAGAPAGSVAVADHQTAGRGRRGRTWAAPAGSSLLVSVLVRPTLGIERAHVMTMAAGLAVLDAVAEVAGVRGELKWPNDVVVGPRKLAGLLAEADVSARGAVAAVVIGVGCNVNQKEFPPDLAPLATSCARESGRAIDRFVLLDAFLAQLAVRLRDLDAVVADYRVRLATLGRSVRVDLGEEILQGTAVDVDELGRLVVAPTGAASGVEPVAVAVGDVVHLRPLD